MEFKDRLKKIRKERRLTQRELGEISDINSEVISFYETGIREPSIGNLHKLCYGLKCSSRKLLGF